MVQMVKENIKTEKWIRECSGGLQFYIWDQKGLPGKP